MQSEAWTQYVLAGILDKALQGMPTVVVSAIDRRIVFSPPNPEQPAPGYLLKVNRVDVLPIIKMKISMAVHARLSTAIRTGKLPPVPPSHRGIRK
jgi:hypothetical protein